MASRYWVGGTGNWSDATNHWSASDGGSPGAGLFPTNTDDVFFTDNSGFGSGGEVSLNGAYYSVVCHDFTVSTTHSIDFDYVSSDISIYGSLSMESGTTFTFGTYLYFLSSSTETVQSNGGIIVDSVFFGYDMDSTYTNGSWFIVDDATTSFPDVTSGSLTIDNGVSFNVLGKLNIWDTITEFTNNGTIAISGGELYTEIGQDVGDVSVDVSGIIGNGSGDITIGNLTILPSSDLQLDLAPGSSMIIGNTFTANGLSGDEITITSVAAIVADNPSRNDTQISIYNGGVTAVAQSFTCIDCLLVRAHKEFRQNIGNPTGNVYCKIYAHSGTYGTSSVPTGSPLATSEGIDVSTFTSTYNQPLFSFVGVNQIQLSSENEYVVAFEYTGGDSSNYIRVMVDSTALGNTGNYSSYSGSWIANNAYDLVWWYIAAMAPHTISKASGVVSCDYLNLSHSNATGGASWYAGANSTDTIGNTGWIFSDAPINVVGPFPVSRLDIV